MAERADYYHPDHLGSSSLITNLAGEPVQHIEYVPFGEVLIDERQTSSTWATPYKFNAKELDEETGLYYYGARYMDPRTSIWLSVDPLAEKKPWISSYLYCLDNPLKYIDPDGEDEWEVNNSTGKVTVKPNEKCDIIRVTDKNGQAVKDAEVVMKKGSVLWQQSANINNHEYNGFSISGDVDGSSVFKMLARKTKFEWGQAKTGNNDRGANIISSSSEEGKNRAANFFSANTNYRIRAFIHSHPRNTPYPSGLGEDDRSGDIPSAREWTNGMQKKGFPAPVFQIYLPGKNSTIDYNANSKEKDFNLNPVVVNLKAIEIRSRK